MRQDITQDQWDQLPDAQKDYLICWRKASVFCSCWWLFTIGELIAFLDDHLPNGWHYLIREGRGQWRINTLSTELDQQTYSELIDALWDATCHLLPALVDEHEGEGTHPQ